MPSCPHCQSEIVLRLLKHQGLLRSERICPYCGGAFTVDALTKRRQAWFIVLAVISLLLTVLSYFEFADCLSLALVSYLLLGALIAWGNRKVKLVPFTDSTVKH